MIDTHTHLYLEEFAPRPSEAVARAIEAGVSKMIFPNINTASIAPMKELNDQFPDCTYMAMGLHPSDVQDGWQEAVAQIGEELDNKGSHYIAVGEIGLDLYWDKSYAEQQMIVFEQQCLWAIVRQLPVIIHCREALEATLEVLKGLPEIPQGVMHSFGGTTEDVGRIRAIAPNFYFGINGIVTFKNSELRDTLPAIGLNRVLLETDSPYLAPVPMRGRRNESAYLIHTAAHVAASLGVSSHELEKATDASAMALFRI